MKRLSLVLATQTIALLIIMAASVLPLYGQEIKIAQEPASTVSAQNEEQGSLEPSAAVSSNPQVGSSQTATPQTTKKTFVFPTKRERLNRYVNNTVGPFTLLRVGISAGLDQWRDSPDEWEQGMSGYGKRYASNFSKNTIQQTVIYGLDSALGVDTGFRRSTRKGFWPRMADALLENVTSRTKTGKRVISVPRFAGVYSSRIIAAETWYPERYSYKDGLRSGTRSLVTGFGMNLLREFVIKF